MSVNETEVWIDGRLVGGVSLVESREHRVYVAMPLFAENARSFRDARAAERWLKDSWARRRSA